MIGIIDYGSGNIMAFVNAYRMLNMSVRLIRDETDMVGVDRVILPGVGAFDHAMERLDRSGLRPVLDQIACGKKIPFLGVCVGMQMLASSSEEGSRPGLGWIHGRVRRFDPAPEGHATPVPHMGWNDVKPLTPGGLFRGLEDDTWYYFLHSYYFECERREDMSAITKYGIPFASAIGSGNIFGVQFHPEKSHKWGIRLLRNFASL